MFLSVVHGDIEAPSIDNCTAFEPRENPANDVLDLRVDDIAYIAAIGDSSMAGFGMENYTPWLLSFLSPKTRTEYRGKNFVSGADPGVPTFANFLKHYNPDIQGGSVGKHGTHVCFGPCPLFLYNPSLDKLNAARAGARSTGLMSQLNYLEEAFKKYPDYKDKWKMIVFQVGANDACNNCLPKYKDTSSMEFWTNQVEEAIFKIKNEYPKTILYIIGNFKLSKTLFMDGNLRQCPHSFYKNYKLCPCGNTNDTIAFADELINEYNYILKYIADRLPAKAGDDFGVIYSGAPDDPTPLPFEALGNVDCFHPSVAGHEWLAKVIWNDLFAPETPGGAVFDPQLRVICPLPSHRLPVITAQQ